ncbi:2-polyprenyl-6-methoxyphenol hydroxylase [Brachybacterium endophyticum]|uniref:2-polyprenyl-6-methoxyphenol hydroxylase n=1 Tax=Brachybacterium endophyticum TaxID=2182385 RepID=A0A2U2RMK4_9MICO|nr:2-polyprenyl-6-methoxyphenol hydroxylase [Brachybacterium endophyticum]
MRIRVLGAGIAGTAAAGLLAAAGHDVELVDERFALPSVGTSLALFPPAQRVLERLGVLETVRERSTAPREGLLVGLEGRVLARIPSGRALLTPRTHVLSCLLDSLPPTVRRRTETIRDVRPLREDVDVLVGADGVHSPTRLSGWGERAAARTHGVTILRGTLQETPPEISETWGGPWLFGITPLPGGGTNWFASIPEHREPDRAGDLAHLREVLGGVRAPIDAVLSAADPARTLVHGLATVPRIRPVHENVVLIGDAAHAMAPNLGHAANTALQDADALSRALSRTDSVAEGLRAYTTTRHLPDQAWRLGSRAMMVLGSADRTAPARDAVLGALGRMTRPPSRT